MTHQQIIELACNGNQDAINFFHDIYNVAQLWDDLIDRDKILKDNDIHNVMDALLFRLPTNKFYAQNENFLRPILVIGIYNWLAANKLEREPADLNDLHISYILRSAYADLLSACTVLFYKRDEAVKIICEIRRYAHSEGFDHYRQDLFEQQVNRGEV